VEPAVAVSGPPEPIAAEVVDAPAGEVVRTSSIAMVVPAHLLFGVQPA
jgi:hypothetical protein